MSLLSMCFCLFLTLKAQIIFNQKMSSAAICVWCHFMCFALFLCFVILPCNWVGFLFFSSSFFFGGGGGGGALESFFFTKQNCNIFNTANTTN